jgi:hypothetical protein
MGVVVNPAKELWRNEMERSVVSHAPQSGHGTPGKTEKEEVMSPIAINKPFNRIDYPNLKVYPCERTGGNPGGTP